MGLLDDLMARQNAIAPYGVYPTPVTAPVNSQYTGTEFATFNPQADDPFGPAPAVAPPTPKFGTGAAPFGFANPLSGADSSPFQTAAVAEKPPETVPLPTARPTDVSSSNRMPGPPMSLAPPSSSAPEAPATASAPAAPEKSWLDTLRGKVNDNSNMLLAFAGGLAGGRSWGDGLSRGSLAAVSGGQLDTKNRQSQMTRTATYAALKARGVSDADAMLAMQNPEALKSLLTRLWPTFKATNVGNTAMAFDESTGTFKPGFTAPKIEKLGPGDTLVNVPGSVPGSDPAASGSPSGVTTIASGGPRAPASGYEYRDPNDPTKGLIAQEGGPADKIPAEVGARLGLAKSFLGQLPDIRKRINDGELTGPVDGPLGAMNIGKAGELRRQIASGAEALLRNLTGAGMNENEANEYVKRYRVEWNDSAPTVLSKMTQLERELRSIDQVVSKGRSGPVLSSTPSASDPLGVR